MIETNLDILGCGATYEARHLYDISTRTRTTYRQLPTVPPHPRRLLQRLLSKPKVHLRRTPRRREARRQGLAVPSIRLIQVVLPSSVNVASGQLWRAVLSSPVDAKRKRGR